MRPFDSAFTQTFLRAYQDGVMQYSYRGIACLRSPIDMAIQARAIWDLEPGTVIEIGSHAGGSALWLADLLQCYGFGVPVHSIDVTPPELHDDRIIFIEGDVTNLWPAFEKHGLHEAPRPWFVLEDSAHTHACCLAALNFLAQHMVSGDLLVMEDGLLDELGVSERYEGGPNRAIAEFMARTPGTFEIARQYCDMFGQNATYAPNGYLKKI